MSKMNGGLYRRHRPGCKAARRRDAQRRGFDPGCDCRIYWDRWADGKRTNVSLGTSEWGTALVMQAGYLGQEPIVIERERAAGIAPISAAGRIPLAEAIERYLVKRGTDKRQGSIEDSSLSAIETSMSAFSAFAGPLFLDQIVRKTFDDYRAERLKRVKPSTLAKEIRHLRTWWAYFEEEGLVPKLPRKTFETTKDADQSKVGFSDEQIKAIKAAIREGDTRMRALVNVMLHTGLRIIDVARLERKAITPEDCPEAGGFGCGRLIVKPWKTRKHRLLPVNIPVPREIMELLAALPDDGRPYYFWSGGGQIESAISSLRKSIITLLKRADCTHVTPLTGDPKKAGPHTFRHTTARLLRDARAEDEDAAAWLGHTVQTFRSFYCGETPATQRRRDAITLKF